MALEICLFVHVPRSTWRGNDQRRCARACGVGRREQRRLRTGAQKWGRTATTALVVYYTTRSPSVRVTCRVYDAFAARVHSALHERNSPILLIKSPQKNKIQFPRKCFLQTATGDCRRTFSLSHRALGGASAPLYGVELGWPCSQEVRSLGMWRRGSHVRAERWRPIQPPVPRSVPCAAGAGHGQWLWVARRRARSLVQLREEKWEWSVPAPPALRSGPPEPFGSPQRGTVSAVFVPSPLPCVYGFGR